MPIHIVTESREDYVDRQNKALVFTLKFFWYGIIAYFLISPILGTALNDQELGFTISMIFFVACLYADFVSKGKIKSIIKVILGVIYLILGIGAAWVVLLGTPGSTSSDKVVGGIVVVALLYAGYKNINRYTNVISFLSEKIGR